MFKVYLEFTYLPLNFDDHLLPSLDFFFASMLPASLQLLPPFICTTPQTIMGNVHSLSSFHSMQVKVMMHVFNPLHQSFRIGISMKLWHLYFYFVLLHILRFILLTLPDHLRCKPSFLLCQFQGIQPLHHQLHKLCNLFHYV